MVSHDLSPTDRGSMVVDLWVETRFARRGPTANAARNVKLGVAKLAQGLRVLVDPHLPTYDAASVRA